MSEFLPEPHGEEPKYSEPHYVRRVELPSGKIIEVVYFDEDLASTEHAYNAENLTICQNPECASTLVYPTEWDEAGPEHWDVSLRCPNCEWASTNRFSQEVVEDFDEQLDRGTDRLVDDYRRMVHINTEDEIGRFVLALEDDHILPEDF